MKVLDVIKLVTRLLNESDDKKCAEYCETNNLSLTTFLGYLHDDTQTDLPEFLTIQAEKDLKLILDCINIAQMQICTDFHSLLFEEEIEVTDSEISIDTLSQKLYKVKQITQNDEPVKYSFVKDKIVLNNGKYKIKYAYLPSDVDFTSNLETHNGNLTILSLSYGVCSQFCLIKGITDESEAWQTKFEKSLSNNFKKVGEIKIKSRRWL